VLAVAVAWGQATLEVLVALAWLFLDTPQALLATLVLVLQAQHQQLDKIKSQQLLLAQEM
jgi:hypothetical protein